MDTRDILNIFLIVGFLIMTVCMVFVTYFFIQALKAVTSLAEHLKETTAGLRDKVGLKTLAAIPPILIALIGRLFRRGRG